MAPTFHIARWSTMVATLSILSLNSAQIRKDLACFGEFGTRGVGYNVTRLKEQLVHTLGIDRKRNVLIVGAGNLGMALADYAGFNRAGFEIVALVDVDAEKVGRASRSGIPVLSYTRIAEIVRENAVEIGRASCRERV